MDCYLYWEGGRVVGIGIKNLKVLIKIKVVRSSITGGDVQVLNMDCGCWEGGGSVGIGIESVVINLKGVGSRIREGLDGELGGGG